jgi:hypothetical protein
LNEFVDQCRGEWKRLGVPDPVADEMVAELAADLEEAEAEGVSAEEVLGSGAFDPRSFAAAWAAERGVVQSDAPNGHRFPRRPRLVAAIGSFALVAVSGGALVVGAPSAEPTRLAITAPAGPPMVVGPTGRVVLWPAPPPVEAVRIAVAARDAAAYGVALPPPAGDTRVVAVAPHDSGADVRMLGWVLLAVGLAGATALTTLRLGAPA